MKVRFIRNLLLGVILVLGAVSCVHEFPDETEPAEVVLKLEFNIDIDVNVEMNMNTEINTGLNPSTKTLTSETHDIRYIVKFYRFMNGELVPKSVYEHTFTVDDINIHEFEENLEIAEGQYRIFVWGDYLEQGSVEDHHYITTDFPLITLNLPESGTYEGSQESRDAYIGYSDIEVVRRAASEDPITADINIHRPLGKFVIISEDLDEFMTKITQQNLAETKAVDLSEYSVKIFYQGDESTIYNAPITFDAFIDKPVATFPGLNFTSKIVEVYNSETGKTEAQLGFDYVFVNGSETHTRIVVAVYDKNGEQVAMTKSMKIPLKRNQVTYVRGGFLMENTKGGVAINPGFSGPDFTYIII